MPIRPLRGARLPSDERRARARCDPRSKKNPPIPEDMAGRRCPATARNSLTSTQVYTTFRREVAESWEFDKNSSSRGRKDPKAPLAGRRSRAEASLNSTFRKRRQDGAVPRPSGRRSDPQLQKARRANDHSRAGWARAADDQFLLKSKRRVNSRPSGSFTNFAWHSGQRSNRKLRESRASSCSGSRISSF